MTKPELATAPRPTQDGASRFEDESSDESRRK